MNLRSKRPAALLAASGVTAALVLASPMGADAAKMITGKDIKNSSISSADIKNGSLKVADFATGQAPTAGPTGPVGPAGKDGKDGKAAPQPTTVAFTGSYTSVPGSSQAVLQTTAKIPANSLVTGVNLESTGFEGCTYSRLYATVDDNDSFAYLYNSDSEDPQVYTEVTANGPAASPVTLYAYCSNSTDSTLPSFDFKATLAYTPIDPKPSATFDGVVAPEPTSGSSRLASAPQFAQAPPTTR